MDTQQILLNLKDPENYPPGDRYLNRNEAADMVAEIKKFIAGISQFCLK